MSFFNCEKCGGVPGVTACCTDKPKPVYRPGTTLAELIRDGVAKDLPVQQIIAEAAASGYIIDEALVRIVGRDFDASTHQHMAALSPKKKAVEPNWRTPTTYLQRFGDALELMCNGARPPDDLMTAWLDGSSEALQDFAAFNAPHWAQGIVTIEAAQLMADSPTEDVDHEGAPTTATTPAPVIGGDEQRRELVTRFFAEDWAIDAALNLLHDFEQCGITTAQKENP